MYQAETFHYHVERAVRRQKSRGVGITCDDWGQKRPLRPELMCGCPLTLLVLDRFGYEKTIEMLDSITIGIDGDDRIAELLELEEKQVIEFRRGFDSRGTQPITLVGALWRKAGEDLRKVFITRSLSSTYKTNHLHDFAMELHAFDVYAINDGITIPGLKPIIKALEEWEFKEAMELRFQYQEGLQGHQGHPTVYTWLKEFFGG